ncbi:hypothetical protein HWV62_8773 [Athelia sp. TMB]|nr:hypothetical protein HWV62_8773 [Athelia sp. TMB]
MPKQKSSATSSTRKKHARKAAGPISDPPPTKGKPGPGKDGKKTKKGDKKGEPRVKAYIPPVKPQPIAPDPLDSLGLAYALPAELVVILRRLGKKDTVTKRRALEELQSYVDAVLAADDEYAVREMLPVWLHHASLLFLHPSKRIRLLSATLHGELLSLLPEELPPFVLGAWRMAAHDPDKHVAAIVSAPGPATKDELLFLRRALLDPRGLWASLNPAFRVGGEEKDGEDVDEEGENEADRNARFRVDAHLPTPEPENVALEEDEDEDTLAALLTSSAFWSTLNSETDPDGLGSSQPAVRRAAWALVSVLVQRWKAGESNPISTKEKNEVLPVLSGAALRSAWSEPDVGVWRALRDPLLVFLRAYPEAWVLADLAPAKVQDQEKDDDHSDPDDDEYDHEDEERENRGVDEPEGQKAPYSAYEAFLSFLPRPPAPGATYPALVVLLSTIPPALRTPSEAHRFFDALWEGLSQGFGAGSGAGGGFGGEMLAKAELECLVFIVRSSIRPNDGSEKADTEKEAEAVGLVHDQFARTLSEFFEGRLRLSPTALGRELSGALGVLGRVGSGKLVLHLSSLIADCVRAWSPLSTTLTSPFILDKQAPVVLDILRALPDGESKTKVVTSIGTWALDAGVNPLVGVLATFAPELLKDPTFAEANTPENLPAFVAMQGLTEHLTPTGELDTVLEGMLGRVLESSASNESEKGILRQLLSDPTHFISPTCVHTARRRLGDTFVQGVNSALRDPESDISAGSRFGAVATLLVAISPAFEANEIEPVLSAVFGLAYFVSIQDEEQNRDGIVSQAKSVWRAWVGRAPNSVFLSIKKMAREMLVDISALPSPELILNSFTQDPGFEVDLFRDILPVHAELDSMLAVLPSEPVNSSLGVLDSLLAYPSSGSKLTPLPYDTRGLSSYARATYAILHMFGQNRQLARQNIWALRHLLALSIYADDAIQLSLELSPVFGAISPSQLKDIVDNVQQVTTYLLGSATDEGFHRRVIAAISDGKISGLDGLEAFLLEVVGKSKAEESARGCRILFRVLHHLFANANKDEADAWLALARKLEKTAPRTSISIITAITRFAPEPSRLDRYRNELAADLFGVPASKANTVGLHTLRKLSATAPDPESDVIFLPQQRAINVMKACQRWVASDDEISEEVESEMTSIFLHFAPLLQNVPGPHWDLIFDLIESNLESCSLAEDDALVVLARTLRLIIIIEDLAATNKTLRSDWHARRTAVFAFVLNLVEENPSKPMRHHTLEVILIRVALVRMSTPCSTCRELVLYILQELPSSLIDQETLPKMCHLLTDASSEVQKMAYGLLQEAAKKRTEYLVIEAGVDTEDLVQAELPVELTTLLQRSLNHEDDLANSDSVQLGYLLTWMVAFDLFTDSSMKVRSDYVNQLRNLDLIAARFIPSIFNLLNLCDGAKKAFKLDPWAVDEYYIEHYESGMALSLQLLASHLFYRALLTVPSLVRKWLHDCTDRQLYSAVVAYTSQHFSPVIIRTELAHIKDPAATAELVDDTMTIKVAQAVNEVTASYLVDEHQLEITLKMPNDWPLHNVEIKDLKKVGVLEDRWRGWVLGVQQIIWSQNGRIVDGLRHFKKNVALHFEGQVECAICYSFVPSFHVLQKSIFDMVD